MLSPPPKTPSRSVMQSPKQIDGRISLYITPMDRKCADLKESPNSVTYLIDRSPAKVSELANILQCLCWTRWKTMLTSCWNV